MDKLVVFQLENEKYGIDIQQINSIERVFEITPIPQTESYIKGIINLRGEVIPIIDLKDRLAMGVTEIKNQTRIIIVKCDDLLTGLLVDAATDVIDIDASSIEESPEVITSSSENSFIQGIINVEDDLVILLDLHKILTTQMIESITAKSESLVNL